MLCENIRKRREQCNMTQVELARKIGITQTAVSLFERGKKIPSLSTIEQIADSLNCSIDWLLDRSSERE